VIGLILWLYRRKHGHFPKFSRTPAISRPVAANPNRRRQRGVWRATQEEGLPGYTVQARGGELSLGTGRKRADEEDYEMTEPRSSDLTDERTRENSVATVLETDEPPPVATEAGDKAAEALPPYIPPPPPIPAVLAEAAYRVSSRQSTSSRRSIQTSGSSSSPRRLSLPRIVAATTLG
jgi:hypothetical protein